MTPVENLDLMEGHGDVLKNMFGQVKKDDTPNAQKKPPQTVSDGVKLL